MTVRTLRLISGSQCNLKCFYCCHEGYISKQAHPQAESLTRACHIISEIFGTKRIKLTGGEPLLWNGISALISLLASEKKYHLSLVTNGTQTKVLKNIIGKISRNIHITISLPSIQEGLYDNITNTTGMLPKVLNSIDLITSDQEMPLRVNAVITSGNIAHLLSAEYLDYIQRHRIELRLLQCTRNHTNRGLSGRRILSLELATRAIKDRGFKMLNDSRSQSVFSRNGVQCTLVKAFCESACRSCPEDKSSLWLASDGMLKSCVRSSSSVTKIKDINDMDKASIIDAFNLGHDIKIRL